MVVKLEAILCSTCIIVFLCRHANFLVNMQISVVNMRVSVVNMQMISVGNMQVSVVNMQMISVGNMQVSVVNVHVRICSEHAVVYVEYYLHHRVSGNISVVVSSFCLLIMLC